MQRFTISLDDELAHEFDHLIAERGYVNRSEAVRDMIRDRLGHAVLDEVAAPWCAATVSYVYDHHEHVMTARLMDLQHDHHDLVISSQHTHLDHDNCLETVILRGPTAAVRACASQMVALRGVRHGQIHLVPLAEEGHGHRHAHAHSPKNAAPVAHKHLRPVR